MCTQSFHNKYVFFLNICCCKYVPFVTVVSKDLVRFSVKYSLHVVETKPNPLTPAHGFTGWGRKVCFAGHVIISKFIPVSG